MMAGWVERTRGICILVFLAEGGGLDMEWTQGGKCYGQLQEY